MSNQTQSNPQQAEPADRLLQLVNADIPRDQARLKSQTNVDADRVMVELSGTVLEYMRDLVRELGAVRDWTYQSMNAISDHLEATDERLELIEAFGNDTMMMPEDAETFAKVVVGCKFLAETMLAGPFPIVERDDEGKTKLAELVVLCEEAERIIQESVLTEDEDEDGDEDEDEDEDGDEE